MNIIFWLIIIVGTLFMFDVPQKLYKKLTQHKNDVEEVKSGRNFDDWNN